MRFLLLSSSLLAVALGQGPVRGSKCAPNQVINRVTVYEDGAIEAECGPLPCGASGFKCADGNVACRGDSDIFSGMAWASNGQSVLLRCCALQVPNKIYVGTDLVTSGSYYVGGKIAEKDKYSNGGDEYDFVTNIRTEQGGVRVWVYRVMCGKDGAPLSAPQSISQSVAAPATFAPVPMPIGGQPAPASKQSFEDRRKYLLERLSGRQQAVAEEPYEEEEEEEEESPSPAPRSFNPLRFRPSQ